MLKGQRILVAPLDWGLGHTTRCIPIIRSLERAGAQLILAASNKSYWLLKEAYPHLPIIRIPGYDIQYTSHFSTGLSIFSQIPKILHKIRQEHRIIKKLVAQYKLSLILSDNRYGCWHNSIPSVFITHQINIKCPPLLQRFEPLLFRLNRHFIRYFDRCWIPDYPGHPNLSGDLSHRYKIVNSRFIGPLSRFKKSSAKIKYDLLIILSGPEPQRSHLERKMLQQLQNTAYKVIMIRGLPGKATSTNNNDSNIELVNHLPTKLLNKKILQSKYVIARAGYSTIMDLTKLQKKALLIPTPGQTEQQYLAQHLQTYPLFHFMRQSDLDIEKGLQKLNQTSSLSIPFTHKDLLTPAIKELKPLLNG